MATDRYDIFQMDDGRPVWLECTETTESLRSRVEDLQKKYARLLVYDARNGSRWNPFDVLRKLNRDAPGKS